MKKILVVVLVLAILLTTCGCGKVKELENENTKLKEEITELEDDIKKLEDEETKLNTTIKNVNADKDGLKKDLDAANKKVEDLEAEKALLSDTGLGFTPGEHFSYFMIQVNKTSLYNTWKLGMQYKEPEYITNDEGKRLVGYRIQDIVYKDFLTVLYGTGPDNKHADTIMIQAAKKGDSEYDNQYLELVLEMIYGVVDYKIDAGEWKESDRNDIATAIFGNEEYDGIKLVEIENSKGLKVSIIKLAN